MRSNDKAVLVGKSARTTLSRDEKFSACGKRFRLFQYPGKASSGKNIEPVPQTDTGRHPENGKASGKTIPKELGKKAGRNFGRCPARFNRATTNDSQVTV